MRRLFIALLLCLCLGCSILPTDKCAQVRLMISTSPEMLEPKLAIEKSSGWTGVLEALPNMLIIGAGIAQPWAFAAYAVGNLSSAAGFGFGEVRKNNVVWLQGTATEEIVIEFSEKGLPTAILFRNKKE